MILRVSTLICFYAGMGVLASEENLQIARVRGIALESKLDRLNPMRLFHSLLEVFVWGEKANASVNIRWLLDLSS